MFIKSVIYLFTFFQFYIYQSTCQVIFFLNFHFVLWHLIVKKSIPLLSVRWSVIIFRFIYTEQHYLELQAFKTTISLPSFSSLFFNVINTLVVFIVFKIHYKCSGDVLPVELWSSGLHKSISLLCS